MRLIVTERDAVLADVSVVDEAVYIGSRPGCKVHLHDLRLAKQHCVIFPEPEGRWILEQLDEKGYTRVNGMLVSDRRVVKDGDTITILDYVIKVQAHEQRIEPTVPPAPGPGRTTLFPLPPNALVRKPDEDVHLNRTQLDQLRRIGLSFNKTSSLSELVDLTLMTLLQVFKGRHAWMCVSGGPASIEVAEGRNMSGHPVEQPPLAEKLRFRCIDRSQHVCLPNAESEGAGSAMAVSLIGPEGKLGMIYVDNRPGSPAYGEAELDFLGVLSAVIGVHVEATVHKQARVRAEVTASELSAARKVKTHLLPSAHPEWGRLRVVRLAEDGERGVSDFYDVVKLTDKNAGLILARSAGPPDRRLDALAQARAAFRVGSLHGDPPNVIVRELNWLLHVPDEHNLLHVCVMHIHPNTGALSYCTAGITHGVVFGARGTPRELPPSKAPPAGAVRNYDFVIQQDTLENDEMLALFTDGTTAITDANGVPLGRNRVVEIIGDVYGQPVAPAMTELMTELHEYVKGGHRPQDLTILLISREA